MVGFQRRPGEEEGLSRVRGWWWPGDGSGNLTVTFPLSVLLPSGASHGGCPPGIPGNCSGDKYLLSSYYVPGAAEMAENKMDTEPARVEPHAIRGGGRYFISRDKCILLCVGAG